MSMLVKHLVRKLELDNTVLRDAQHFQPSSRLAIVCGNVFGEEQMGKMFRQKQGATKFDICDTVKLECHEYLAENIPKSYYMVREQSEKGYISDT